MYFRHCEAKAKHLETGELRLRETKTAASCAPSMTFVRSHSFCVSVESGRVRSRMETITAVTVDGVCVHIAFHSLWHSKLVRT